LNPIPNFNPGQNEVGMIMGACLWIPKKLWLEMGGFPEWFGSIGEDLYLCCRTRLAGYPVMSLMQSGYYHLVGASFGGGKSRQGKLKTTYHRRIFSERNKTFVITLCYPTPLFQLILPLHIALLLIEGTILAILRQDFSLMRVVYLGCLRDLRKELSRLMLLRKQIQSTKKINLWQFLSPFSFFPHKLRLLYKYGIPSIK